MKARTLQDKMDEQSRLSRAYRARVRKELREALAAEPRLVSFRKALRRTHGARAIVSLVADSWIRTAPTSIRWLALRMLTNHCGKLSVLNGGEFLDDPVPPKKSAFQYSKDLIFSGGGMR